ncbi:MAG: hypothetical protein HY742_06320 [Deltaproteobacteria bacterium]|nr:hypothetical protein [Deltaproteobacteria bacterium]
MKKTAMPKTHSTVREDLRPEYNFDYRKAKPNRFAGQKEEGRVVVVLDPDVSEVFRTPDSLNKVLRTLIEAMPSKTKRKRVSA